MNVSGNINHQNINTATVNVSHHPSNTVPTINDDNSPRAASPTNISIYVTNDYPPEGIAVPMGQPLPNAAYQIPNLFFPVNYTTVSNNTNFNPVGNNNQMYPLINVNGGPTMNNGSSHYHNPLVPPYHHPVVGNSIPGSATSSTTSRGMTNMNAPNLFRGAMNNVGNANAGNTVFMPTSSSRMPTIAASPVPSSLSTNISQEALHALCSLCPPYNNVNAGNFLGGAEGVNFLSQSAATLAAISSLGLNPNAFLSPFLTAPTVSVPSTSAGNAALIHQQSSNNNPYIAISQFSSSNNLSYQGNNATMNVAGRGSNANGNNHNVSGHAQPQYLYATVPPPIIFQTPPTLFASTLSSTDVIMNRNSSNQNNRHSNSNKKTGRQSMFKPYWTEELTTNGLQAGKIIQGCLRINPKNFEHSFVIHPSKNADVFICGMTARNRALHGDSVAVAIKPRKDWRVFDEYLSDPDNSIDENHVSSAKGVNQRQLYITLADVKEKHKELWEKLIVSDTFDLESNADPNETEVASSWSQYLQRTGEVVAIVKKLHTRKCVGCLRSPNNNGGVHPTTTLFDPVDSRIPRLNISRSCWPQDFSKCPDRFKNTKFVAKIVEWSENGPCAKGELIETLENMDLVDLLTKEILITAGLKSSPDFSEAVLTDVEQCKVDISEEEINLRQDFRDYCIFTIDPSSARDLDDAIHFRRLSDGNVELGVHIADVSHYVQPNSELDKEAADRATTVYLVDRIIPMLPRKLCEQLCTLTPGQDKLAFSVVWVMQPENAQIVSMRFYRSVIRSCAKLSYYDAQACLDAPNKTFHEDEFPKVEAPFTVSLIRDTILDIALITRQLRLRRVEDGALRLQNPKLSFKLSETNKAPVGFEIYQLSEANWLIEELMLLANMSVAKALMDYVPGEALLRRHEPPDSRVLNGALRLLNRLGYHVNGSSSKALQNSITRISEEIRKSYSTESRSIGTMQLLVNWCSKSMKNAEYICASLCSNDVHKCHHYALNAPFYTHFTSPIRRYADVIVHRQLASILPVLNGEQEPHLDDGSAVMWVSERANWCNMMKKAAKEASEKSSELYFSIFVKECGPLTEDCLVFNVLDRSFDVIIISCGFIKRVYCELLDFKSQSCGDVKGKEEILKSLENLDIDSTPQDSSSGTLITSQSAFREMTIQWPLTDDCTHKLEQSIKCQDLVNCSISCKIVNDNYKLTVILNRPKCTLCDAL